LEKEVDVARNGAELVDLSIGFASFVVVEWLARRWLVHAASLSAERAEERSGA
jgi:hypothetical protein